MPATIGTPRRSMRFLAGLFGAFALAGARAVAATQPVAATPLKSGLPPGLGSTIVGPSRGATFGSACFWGSRNAGKTKRGILRRKMNASAKAKRAKR